MRKRGVGTLNAGAQRPRRPCCATRREAGGLVHPFPREWGRAACPRVPPVRAYGAARSRGRGASCPFHTNGKWGQGLLALARPFPARTGRRGRREVPGAACPSCAHPFCADGKGGAGGRLPLRAPVPRIQGGAVKGGRGGASGGGVSLVPLPARTARRGRGAREVPGAARPCAPPFRANGKGGAGGGVPSRAPSVRMGRRGGGQCGIWGRGGEGLTLGRPLRANGKEGAGERGRGRAGALVRTPSVGSGKGRRRWVEGAAVSAGWGKRDPPLCASFCAQAGQCGGRGRGGGNLPCLHANGAARDVGDGDVGFRKWVGGGREERRVVLSYDPPNPVMPRTPTWQAHFAFHHSNHSNLSPSCLPFPPPFLVEQVAQADALFPRIDHRRPVARRSAARNGRRLASSLLPRLHLICVEGGRTRARRLRPLPFPLSQVALYTQKGQRDPRPLPCLFAWKGGARGHAAPSASLLPWQRLPVRAGRGMRDTLPPLPVSPSLSPPPFGRAAVYARERGMRGYATPGPALPIRSEGGYTRARHPRHLPCPLAALSCMRGKGHEGHPVATGPSLSPFDRAALYARDSGAQGRATPGPTLPIRAEGARTRGMPPRAPLSSTAPPCTRGKGARKGSDPRPHFPFVWKGHDAPLPLDRAAPYARTGGTRGQAALPHSRGKGCTRPPASLRVAQQGRRGLRAPAFNVPAPVFACYCTT
ncbi:hypothetical protein EDB83DRAFT_2317939 [Lactarius deliciosus]|nr:hypothetical protein EDB83DRAFT_2317939 [Lactarius deliciosus]